MKSFVGETRAEQLGAAARTVGGIAAVAGLALAIWRYPLATGAAVALAGILFMHELGHYAAARVVGMKVTDFFLGFGPRLWSFRRGETTYGLRALPLGAYVRIIGMTRNDVVDPHEESKAYRSKSYPRRVLVVCAGSLMHMFMASAALLAVHAVFGAPVFDPNRWQVADVLTARDGVVLPAGPAGIEAGDRIIAVNDQPTRGRGEFVSAVQSRPGEQVVLRIERDGDALSLETTLAVNPQTGTGLLGVRAEQTVVYETVGLPAAALRSAADLGRSVIGSAQGLWTLVTNLGGVTDRIVSPPGDPSAASNLETRPVSVIGIVHLASDPTLGWSQRLGMFALVNVFLGVFNMVPLPPFDGGHLAVATYERWRERAGRGRYHSDPGALAPLLAAVVVALALLAIGLLYLDIANPIDL